METGTLVRDLVSPPPPPPTFVGGIFVQYLCPVPGYRFAVGSEKYCIKVPRKVGGGGYDESVSTTRILKTEE
eukprot:SAG31_NODE_17_length_35773_cov_25.999271_7_plen_72_part_00